MTTEDKIYQLYRLSAKLNLYICRCDYDKSRVINELEQIKKCTEDILKIVNEQ